MSNPLRILKTLPAEGATRWLDERQFFAVAIPAEDITVGYALALGQPVMPDPVPCRALATNMQLLGEYLGKGQMARRSLEKLASLAGIATNVMMVVTEEGEALKAVARALSRVRGAISACVGLVDEATGGLRIVSVWGRDLGYSFLHPGEGFSGWVVREGQPLVR